MARGEWWFGTADIGKSIGNASCSFSCFADPVKFLNTWSNSSLSYLWCSKLQKDALKAAQPYLPHNFTIYFLLCNLVLWTAASLFPESSQNIAAIEQWKKSGCFGFVEGCAPPVYIYIYHLSYKFDCMTYRLNRCKHSTSTCKHEFLPKVVAQIFWWPGGAL